MKTQSYAKIMLRGCQRCGGDLVWDEDEYACLQCGRRQALDATSVSLDVRAMALAGGAVRKDSARWAA